ncbi:MAG: rRNA maturation RNase YbeY [Sulfurimonas sp.]|uniref:rRNA maturation RNase YbeY n=1 Tax=Sulfurimonas sp. TaxID=2022749 RepID=UPI0025EFF838|nr:rRNA maturation RNase YbeY [Sulfurimonas sp.]MCK9491743.1 rRNA maturation RNase YbeY [Sulfurimonas sp.]
MIDIDNKTTLNVNEEFLNTIAITLTDKEIELIITDKKEIQEINKAHRGIDSPTDVLSFPYEEMPMSPLGSIVISAPHVLELSKDLGHSSDDELVLLFIHGILHLLGYDHEVDSGEMREEEIRLIKEFNLPDSLIVRTQG